MVISIYLENRKDLAACELAQPKDRTDMQKCERTNTAKSKCMGCKDKQVKEILKSCQPALCTCEAGKGASASDFFKRISMDTKNGMNSARGDCRCPWWTCPDECEQACLPTLDATDTSNNYLAAKKAVEENAKKADKANKYEAQTTKAPSCILIIL